MSHGDSKSGVAYNAASASAGKGAETSLLVGYAPSGVPTSNKAREEIEGADGVLISQHMPPFQCCGCAPVESEPCCGGERQPCCAGEREPCCPKGPCEDGGMCRPYPRRFLFKYLNVFTLHNKGSGDPRNTVSGSMIRTRRVSSAKVSFERQVGFCDVRPPYPLIVEFERPDRVPFTEAGDKIELLVLPRSLCGPTTDEGVILVGGAAIASFRLEPDGMCDSSHFKVTVGPPSLVSNSTTFPAAASAVKNTFTFQQRKTAGALWNGGLCICCGGSWARYEMPLTSSSVGFLKQFDSTSSSYSTVAFPTEASRELRIAFSAVSVYIEMLLFPMAPPEKET